jgi:hypothetical protein
MVKATIILKNGFNPNDYDFGLKDENGSTAQPFQSATVFDNVGTNSKLYVAKRKNDNKEFSEPRRFNLGNLQKIVPNPLAPCVIVFVSFKKKGVVDGSVIGGKPFITGGSTTPPILSTSPSVSGIPQPNTENEEFATPDQLDESEQELVEDVNENPILDVVLEEV